MPHVFEWMGRANSTNWMIGNSQLSRFQIQGDYQLSYKRGGKLPEIMAEAEWVIIAKKATHIVIDGIQNSVRDIQKGTLNLETEVLPRLKALSSRAQVVLSEVLYCPEHLHLHEDTLHLINRQVRRMNKEASGLTSPQPWRALNLIRKGRNRKEKKQVEIFPASYARDNYHINDGSILSYEAELAAYLAAMVDGTLESTSSSR